MRTQIWSPIGNCNCRVEETWDENIGEILSCSQVLNKCEAHQGVKDEELYAVLMSEDQSKSHTMRILLGLEGVSFGLEDDTNSHTFKQGVTFNHSFIGKDKDRQLIFSLDGADLSDIDKTTVQSLLVKKFGTDIQGKVLL